VSQAANNAFLGCMRPASLTPLPDSLRDPELSLDTFKRQLKTYIFAKYWWQNVFSVLEIFLSMRYINLHFTYLLTPDLRFILKAGYYFFVDCYDYYWLSVICWWLLCTSIYENKFNKMYQLAFSFGDWFLAEAMKNVVFLLVFLKMNHSCRQIIVANVWWHFEQWNLFLRMLMGIEVTNVM